MTMVESQDFYVNSRILVKTHLLGRDLISTPIYPKALVSAAFRNLF